LVGSAEFTQDHKKALVLDEVNLKNSNEISLNSTNQTKNGRKQVYSPTNQTNGSSPKKKLLFNSSK
jgi:hypothetical protein